MCSCINICYHISNYVISRDVMSLRLKHQNFAVFCWVWDRGKYFPFIRTFTIKNEGFAIFEYAFSEKYGTEMSNDE